MGGSDKLPKPATGGQAAIPTSGAPQSLAFGNDGNASILAQQLGQAGLLGAVGNPASFYKPVTVPVIDNPGMLNAWMHSQGLPYQNNEGKPVAPPVKSTPGTGSGSGTKTPSAVTASGVYARINGKGRTGSSR